MTDVATASVISTLSVNGITFLVLIILFEVVRGRFEDVYAPKSKWQSGFPRLTPNHGAFAWVRQIQLFSDDDILARVGMDGWVLLRFLRMLAVLSGVASFVCHRDIQLTAPITVMALVWHPLYTQDCRSVFVALCAFTYQLLL
jgi:hypothetical protein